MKKFFLSVLILFTALATSGCAMMLSSQQYGYEEQYDPADFSHLDDYSSIGWNNAEYDLVYGYYDSDRLFLVIYNGRIYVIPYDYFYRHIFPHYLKRQLHWYSYDYFCGLWGWRYYNGLWNHYYYRHNRHFWRPNHDWYGYHRRNNSSRPFVVRKNEIGPTSQGNRFHSQPQPQPRIYNPDNRARIYEKPKKTNYNYQPRMGRRVTTHVGPVPARKYAPPATNNVGSGVAREKKD